MQINKDERPSAGQAWGETHPRIENGPHRAFRRFSKAGLFYIAEAIGPVQVALWLPGQVDQGSLWMMAHPEIAKPHSPIHKVAHLALGAVAKIAYFDHEFDRTQFIYTAEVTNLGNTGTFFSLEGCSL